jgi:hypothetical protein
LVPTQRRAGEGQTVRRRFAVLYYDSLFLLRRYQLDDMISLLDFFRTGQLGDVHLGIARRDVLNSFGSPDDYLNPRLADNTRPWSKADAPIWWYGGIEFFFDTEATAQADTHSLLYIQFKPSYLYRHRWQTHVQRWVFRSQQGPTRQRLAAALMRAQIAYQDTGLETVLYDTRTQAFIVTEYQPVAPFDTRAESFGTLVLRSGVQVRYAEDDTIIQTKIGGEWMFPGKERFIQW